MTTMQIGRCLRQFLGLLQHNGFSTDIADLAYELSTDSQNLMRSNNDLTPALRQALEATMIHAEVIETYNKDNDDYRRITVAGDALANAADILDPVPTAEKWMQATWFFKKTREGLSADRLNKAAIRGLISARKHNGRWQYEVSSVIEYCPDYRDHLTSDD